MDTPLSFTNFFFYFFSIITFLSEPVLASKFSKRVSREAKIIPLEEKVRLKGNFHAIRSRINAYTHDLGQERINSSKFQELQQILALLVAEATEFLDCLQFCSPVEESIIIGGGGGFGSMFQFVAKQFLDAQVLATKKNRAISVRFKGDFKWYTNNSECGHKGFSCFFDTEAEINGSNRFCKRAECPSNVISISNNIFWWGVFQARMFRPNAVLLRAAEELRKKHDFIGFPDIALHIRSGDKSSDRKSRQNIAISPHQYLELAQYWSEAIFSFTGKRAVIYVATDSLKVQKMVTKWGKHRLRTTQIVMQSSKIVHMEESKRHLRESTEAAKVGMHFSSHDKFREALTFLLDLHFMMHAKYFGGLCMSQPARISVNVGFTKGTLLQAIALDEQNIDLIDRWKFGRSEGWSRFTDIIL